MGGKRGVEGWRVWKDERKPEGMGVCLSKADVWSKAAYGASCAWHG